MVKNKTLSVEEKIKQVKLIPPQIERADLISKIERLIKEEDFTLFSDISKELEEFDSALTVDYDFLDITEKRIRDFSIEKYSVGEVRLKEVPYEVYKEGNEIIVRNLVNKHVQRSERMFLEFDGFTKEGFLPSLKGNFLPVIIQLFEENSKEGDDLYCGEDKLKLFNGFKIKGEPYIIQHYAVPLTLERNIGLRNGLEAKININGGVICDGYFGNVLGKKVHNFTIKNLEGLQQKILENKLKKRKKKLVKKIGLAGIAAATLISGAIWINSSINSYYTSPEYLRKKELENNCVYISLPVGEERVYYLGDGKKAVICHKNPLGPGDWLEITLNDEIKFLSENFLLKNFWRELRTLSQVEIKKGNKWEVFPKENSKNYDSWQREYEDLIQKIAEKRLEFEKSRGKQYKEPASEPVSQTRPQYKQTLPSGESQNDKRELFIQSQSIKTEQITRESLEEKVKAKITNSPANNSYFTFSPTNNPYTEWFANRTDVFRSYNGGKIWDTLLTVKNIPGLSINLIDSITVKNREDMIVHLRGGVNEAIETKDGGKTWEHVNYHGRHYGSCSVDFITYNNGRSWAKQN